MREIKLRAWNKKDKKMFYAGSLSGVSDYFIGLNERNEFGDYETLYNAFVSSLIWMESTGIKDKNGKEIYEGDIVKCDIPLRNVFYEENIGYISFDVKASGSINIRNKNDLVSDKGFIKYIDKLEVIGNIYKNKELLK